MIECEDLRAVVNERLASFETRALPAGSKPPDAKTPKPPRAPTGIDDANYPDDLLSKLNAINTRGR